VLLLLIKVGEKGGYISSIRAGEGACNSTRCAGSCSIDRPGRNAHACEWLDGCTLRGGRKDI